MVKLRPAPLIKINMYIDNIFDPQLTFKFSITFLMTLDVSFLVSVLW